MRLVNHVLFYMDDFLLTGTSKKDLHKGMRMLIAYINQFLQLTVKPDWKISKFSDGEPIDMMGFVFRKSKTTIRAKIFIKTRRQFLRAKKEDEERVTHRCGVTRGVWYLLMVGTSTRIHTPFAPNSKWMT